MGTIANRQSLVLSECCQLSQAISAIPLGTNVTRTHANRAIRIAAQRRQGLRGKSDRQGTLVIRNAPITLTSDSAITIARFRPSKALGYCPDLFYPQGFVTFHESRGSNRVLQNMPGWGVHFFCMDIHIKSVGQTSP